MTLILLLPLYFQQSSHYLLHIEGPTVKQILITATRKSLQFYNVDKTASSSSYTKNVPIMHKTLAFREGSMTF